ncbi:hypothetical protein CDL12_28497 [Handroanthus impetiginosus]|uniref:Uncharacterized protein n=1 Tax=Handroanthus impetiginosus TaxID=429701 RepID=A0A2G9G1D2_9LAMI|nr:hypothetical protein CDL12_28497 [Handroanthus impetiginosus]
MKDFEIFQMKLIYSLRLGTTYPCLLGIEEKKQAAADVLFQYSKFALACLGNQARPCDLRLHLMKEISGLPTSLKKASSSSSHTAAAPDAMGESSSSGTVRIDKTDSFRAL